ncbi:TetR/AcrR family transcriptional regulator [Devosia sp.]|uniref:TetR/AcrR family transcriptional regulator n=1 Tax=Devosia sp. TaxID=1871048 RepID=UPI001B052793|nr:TetR/AcrR family transcriptional regulator [Devosia sp.]MBO9589765.1 TetR family transcriptional regulator [Devosia sp.]
MTATSDESVRDKKRRETRQRIVDAGLKLFAGNGYEATTLDAIAAEAGISRRTFFHYFKSKDEILISLQAGLGEQLSTAIRAQPRDRRPLPALRDAMLGMVAPYSPKSLLAIDRMMRSSETVQARKQASYIRDEATVFAALKAHWPHEPETQMRLLAAFAIGAVRLSLDTFSREEGRRPLAALLAESFDALGQLAQQT